MPSQNQKQIRISAASKKLKRDEEDDIVICDEDVQDKEIDAI